MSVSIFPCGSRVALTQTFPHQLHNNPSRRTLALGEPARFAQRLPRAFLVDLHKERNLWVCRVRLVWHVERALVVAKARGTEGDIDGKRRTRIELPDFPSPDSSERSCSLKTASSVSALSRGKGCSSGIALLRRLALPSGDSLMVVDQLHNGQRA